MKLFCTVTALMCALVLSGCNKGPCVSDSDCDDSNACTTDQCASGTCAHAAVVVDDGNVCTTDSCDATKGIQRTLVPTDDGNVCTTDYCEPQAGVKHDAIFTGPCAATRLQFRNEPVAASAGQDFVPAVEVVVIDHDGIVVSSAVGSVSMVLAANGSSAVLAGTQTQPLVNGIAHFADLHVDTQALQVALVASPTGVESGSVILPVTSDPFNVLAPCPAGEVRNAAEGCVSYCDSSVPNPCISPPASTCTGGGSPIATNYQSPGTCAVEGTSPYYTCSSYPSSSTTCTGSTSCQSSTVVVTNTPTCSVTNGTAACSVTTSTTNCASSSQVCSGGTCVTPPVITSATPGDTTPKVAVIGGQVTIIGTSLTGTSLVTIGPSGSAVSVTPDSVTGSTMVVFTVPDTAPTGLQPITVTNAVATSASKNITIAHLLINELDPTTATGPPGNNTKQFVEISTGLSSISLSGYTLLFIDGGTNKAYAILDLGGTALTDSGGYLIVGAPLASSPAPDVSFAAGTLEFGRDSVAVYQGPPTNFDSSTVMTASPAPIPIDALVYEGTNNTWAPGGNPITNPACPSACRTAPTTAGSCQVPNCGNVSMSTYLMVTGGTLLANENDGTDDVTTVSIQRCLGQTARRDGRAFSCAGEPAAPTPRAPSAH